MATTLPAATASRLAELETERSLAAQVIRRQTEDFDHAQLALRSSNAAFERLLDSEKLSARLVRDELHATRAELDRALAELAAAQAVPSQHTPVSDHSPALHPHHANNMDLQLQLAATKSRLEQATAALSQRDAADGEAQIQAMRLASELQAVRTQLSDQQALREQDSHAVQQTLKDLADAKATVSVRNDALEGALQNISNLTRQADSLRVDLQQANRETAEERIVVQQFKTAAVALQNDSAEKMAQLRSIRQVLDRQGEAVQQSQHKLAAANMQISVLQRALDKLVHEKSSLERDKVENTVRVETAQVAVADLQDQVSEHASREALLQLQVNTLTQRVDANRKERVAMISSAEDPGTQKLVLWFANMIRDQSKGSKTAPHGATLLPKVVALYQVYQRQTAASVRIREAAAEEAAAVELIGREYLLLEACNRDRSKLLLKTQHQVRQAREINGLLAAGLAEMDKENTSLDRKIEEDKEMPRLDKEELASLRAQLKDLQLKMIEHDAVIRAKNAEVGAMKAESVRLTKQLATSTADLTGTKQSLENAVAQADKEREFSSSAKLELHICQEELRKVQKSMATMQKDNDRLSSALTITNEERSTLKSQCDDVTNSIHEKESRISQLEATKTELDTKLQELSGTCRLLEQTSQLRVDALKAAQDDQQILQDQLNSKILDLTSARRTIDNTEKLIIQLKEELTEVRTKQSSAEQEKNSLQSQISHQIATLSKLQYSFAQLEREKAVWATRAGTVDSHSWTSRSESAEELGNLESKLKSAEDSCVRTRDDLLSVRKLLKAKTDHALVLEEENVSLQVRLVGLEIELRAAAGSTRIANRSLEEIAAAGRRETLAMQNSLDEMQATLVEREAILLDHKQRGDEAEKLVERVGVEMNAMSERNSELEEAYSNSTVAYTALKDDLEDSKSRLVQAAKAYESLEKNCQDACFDLKRSQAFAAETSTVLEETREAYAKSERRILSLQEELSSAIDQLEASQELCKSTSERLNEMSSRFSNTCRENEDLQGTAATLQNDLEAKQKVLSGVETSLESVRTELRSVAKELSGSVAERSNLELKLEKSDARVVELSKEISERDSLVEAVSKKEHHFATVSAELEETQQRLEEKESTLSSINISLVEKCTLIALLQQRLGNVSTGSALETSVNGQLHVQGPDEGSECSFELRSIASPDLLEQKNRADVLAERLQRTESILRDREMRLAELTRDIGESRSEKAPGLAVPSAQSVGGKRNKGKFDKATIVQLRGLGEFLSARLVIVENLLGEKEKRLGHQSLILGQMQASVDTLSDVIGDKENMLKDEQRLHEADVQGLNKEIARLEQSLEAASRETEEVRQARNQDSKRSSQAYSMLQGSVDQLKSDVSDRDDINAELERTLESVRKELALSCSKLVEVERSLELARADAESLRTEVGERTDAFNRSEASLNRTVGSLRREVSSFTEAVDKLEVRLAESEEKSKGLVERLIVCEPLASKTEHAQSCMELMENRMDMIESQASRRMAEMEGIATARAAEADAAKVRSDAVMEDFSKIQERMHGYGSEVRDREEGDGRGGRVTRVTMVVTGEVQPAGDSQVIVCGGDASLGSWEVERGQRLWFDSRMQEWRGDVLVERGTQTEYKFVWRAGSGGARIWESGVNRVLSVGRHCGPYVQVHEPWR